MGASRGSVLGRDKSNTHVDLVILEMVDFDVILGMTWLSPNFAILDCNAKTVTLAKPETDPLVWEVTTLPLQFVLSPFFVPREWLVKGV